MRRRRCAADGMPAAIACGGCGGHFPPVDGPTHPYMSGSAGCWAAYGAVLAREYQDPALFRVSHRLTVDAYALQHPGDPADGRAVRSVWLHFAALDAILGRGRTHAQATALLQQLAGTDFPSLPARTAAWRLTAADITGSGHVADVEAWAREAYAGWRELLGPTIAALNLPA